MVELEKDIEEKINNLSNEFIILLRKNDLLYQFLKNFITNIICSKFDLNINIDEINKNFCRKNNIDNNEVLLKFLRPKGFEF